MKSFAVAALVSFASAETSFFDFITDMAIQEAEAKQLEVSQPKFAFQELLTQMAIDEMKANEEMKFINLFNDMNKEEKQPSLHDAFVNLYLEQREAKKAQPTFHDLMTNMFIEKREEPKFVSLFNNMDKTAKPSMHDAFVNLMTEQRQEPKQSFTDFMNNLAMQEKAKPSMQEHFVNLAKQEFSKPRMNKFMNNVMVEERLARKNEQKELFSKGLPFAIATMTIKE